VLKDRVVTVRIPAGIHEGQSVRLRGEGEPGEEGAHRGDLHCRVVIQPHPFLERHQNDLYCRVPISFTQAALGTVVEAPALKGKVELKIPPGTQPGQVFRLSGMGLPNLRTGRMGDQLIEVAVEIPRKLNKQQETVLREFARLEDKTVLPESRGFFDKLREYLGGGS
jgi:molecular chaperone DnaJ